MKPTNRHAPKAIRHLLPLLLLAAQTAWALSSDREQPIHIRADRVEINEQTGVSVYVGEVNVSQGSMALTAERLVVHRGADDDIERIEAVGSPATFRQRPDDADSDVMGEARRIVYHADTSKVHLTGDGHVWRGKDEFRGEQIVYDTEREVVMARGTTEGERVHAVIHPKAKKNEE